MTQTNYALLDGKRVCTILGIPYQGIVGVQSLPPHEGFYQKEVPIEQLTTEITGVSRTNGKRFSITRNGKPTTKNGCKSNPASAACR
jgi:hypothetical protein